MNRDKLAHGSSPHDSWDWGALRRRCLHEARRAGLSGADAEDAAQESLVRIWRHRDQCSQPERPEPWAAMIGRREALRLLAGRREHAALDGLTERVGAAPDALGALQIREAVRGMPAHERTLLALRYFADLGQGDVAAVLGAPKGTVAVQLHRARQRLRALLDDEREEVADAAGRDTPRPLRS